jgi:predicted nucleic acid-binding protein
LKAAATHVVVPRAVVEEINLRGPGDPAVDAMHAAGWPDVVDAPAVSAEISAYDLGKGESALLAWGQANLSAVLVLDDARARRCAMGLGMKVQGTLGVIVAAKQQGMIPAAAPVVQSIRDAGLYVSDKLVRLVLASAGE